MSTDLAIIPDTGLTLAREPDSVLEEAHRAAAALKRVIDSKPHKVMFGGAQYLEFEDWQTVGRFYGIAPRILVSRPLTIGDVSGWEASAEAIHVPTGNVVASADAMCMNDEEKWRARPKYEYQCVTKTMGLVLDPPKHEIIWEKGADGKSRPKKERVLVGEEAVPSFQLRSMAQTRAGAKALRNALAWVVVLAGYRPTPAEELDTPPVVRAEEAEFTPSRAPKRVATPEPVESDDSEREIFGGETETSGEPAPELNEAQERTLLLSRCKAAADAVKLDAKARADLLIRYSITDPRTAPLESLSDMLAALRTLRDGK